MSSSYDQSSPNGADFQQRAREELLRHRNWLRTVLVARARGDESLADDLLGDLTIEALATAGRWTGLPETGPWLYRMAVRKFANHWRTEARRWRLDRDYGQRQSFTTWHSDSDREPLELLLDVEREKAVQSALKQIPGKDAELLLLKYVHHWTYTEMEKHLGIPRSKIGHRLRVARQRLAEVLLRCSAIADWAAQRD